MYRIMSNDDWIYDCGQKLASAVEIYIQPALYQIFPLQSFNHAVVIYT